MGEVRLLALLSFDVQQRRWLQILHEWENNRRRETLLLAVFRSQRAVVQFVQVRLEAFLRFFGQAREFNAHANAGIPSTNYCAWR